jgi:uncharacterized protein (DUF1810 family)
MTDRDHFDLDRFVEAQLGAFEAVRQELRAGRKRSHWMWFIFPQLAQLGSSPTARFYGITGRAEARAYLAHPVLGPRLLECTRAVLDVEGRSLQDIFASPDDVKFRSSMTLFDQAADGTVPLFRAALMRYCAGEPDPRTLDLLARAEAS